MWSYIIAKNINIDIETTDIQTILTFKCRS